MNSRRRHGFSLLELLITLTVIGIMAALIGPQYGLITHQAIKERNKNNAQNISSIASVASAAGARFIVPGDKVATIRNLMHGVRGESAGLKGHVFRISLLRDEEIHGVAALLKISDDSLTYVRPAR